MQPGPWTAVGVLLAVVSSGCLGTPSDRSQPAPSFRDAAGRIDHAALDAAIGAPVVMDHDHNDALQHTGSFNVDFVAWSPLGVALGTNGFANFVFHEEPGVAAARGAVGADGAVGAGGALGTDGGTGRTLAFVAVDGDTRGGFIIADVTDPHAMEPLGAYWHDGSGMQEVRVTPDGRYALANVQEIPTAAQLSDLGLADGTPLADCSVCIHVVNVEDPTRPRLESVFPIDLIGTHNLDVVDYEGTLYVFYTGQPLYVGPPTGNPPPGDYVGIARLVSTPQGAQLVKVAEYRLLDATVDQERNFPHDVLVQRHPDGRRIAYVSHWQGGLVTVDVTNPLAPRQLGVHDDPAPSEVLAIHWAVQEEAARPDGRVIAWSAPEIGTLDSGSGVIRSYDVTDPADPRQLGTWTLPGGVTIPGQFLFSPHIVNVNGATGLAAVAHYHAGVWILDATDPETPRALGHYFPHGDPDAPYTGDIWWKKPNFDPEGYGPNVYQARWHDGLLWVSDRGTGLYVLQYTGPVPGPLHD